MCFNVSCTVDLKGRREGMTVEELFTWFAVSLTLSLYLLSVCVPPVAVCLSLFLCLLTGVAHSS